MRNVLFALALVMAASVHFTSQLFPNPDSPTRGPAYPQLQAPPSTYRAPAIGGGSSLPRPSHGNDTQAPSACLDVVDAASKPPSLVASELAPACQDEAHPARRRAWPESL